MVQKYLDSNLWVRFEPDKLDSNFSELESIFTELESNSNFQKFEFRGSKKNSEPALALLNFLFFTHLHRYFNKKIKILSLFSFLSFKK